MEIRELLIEILERYPQEYKRDNKASNTYYKRLKQRIERVFAPLIQEFGLKLHALGGYGIMRKIPYICFPAEDHRPNRGIYPICHFDFKRQAVYLDLGDANEHEPPPELAYTFANRAAEFLLHFQLREDGYPRMVYTKAELQEERLRDDLKAVFEVYQLCLEEFECEIQDYLQAGTARQGLPGKHVIWVIQAGKDGKLWEEWQQQHCISIGWSKLGDPSQFKMVSEIQTALLDAYPPQGNNHSPQATYLNDAHAVHNVVNKMRIGDVVAAIRGGKMILGAGTIAGAYEYVSEPQLNDPDHVSIRKVNWLKTETSQTEQPLPVKTVTPLRPKHLNYQRIAMYMGKDFPSALKKPSISTVQETAGTYQERSIDIAEPALPEIIQPLPNYSKADALIDLFLSAEKFEKIVQLFEYKKNIILQGSPGVGKSFIAKRLAYVVMGFEDDEKVEMIQFHQAYSYEDFIQGYRPNAEGKFMLKNGVFYEFCRKALRDTGHPYVFIIDEINRGNLSKIFGELMVLLEPDKRGRKFAMPLTYSEARDEKFSIPENLYLIGMMNTADRSLAMVDYALRRRFSFVTLEPGFNSPKFRQYLADHGVKPELIQIIIERMNHVNLQIQQDHNLGTGYQIGHSFFCPTETHRSYDETWYQQVITYEIEPLIREYWFDNNDKAEAIIKNLRIIN